MGGRQLLGWTEEERRVAGGFVGEVMSVLQVVREGKGERN